MCAGVEQYFEASGHGSFTIVGMSFEKWTVADQVFDSFTGPGLWLVEIFAGDDFYQRPDDLRIVA